MKFDWEKESHKLLFVFIMTDILFIIIHVLHSWLSSIGLFYHPSFSLAQDRGYAELFQYIKEFWIVMLLIVLAIRASTLLYFCWSLLFGYFLVDDSFGVHETIGNRLTSTLGSAELFGLGAQKFGELFASGFFGLLFLLAIGVSYYVNDDREAREFSRYVFAMIGVLIIFGIVTGLFQGIAPDRSIWQAILRTIEEGGEMLVMSVIVVFVFCFNPEL
jgi:hypothetical protein